MAAIPPVVSFQDPAPPADSFTADPARIISGTGAQTVANLFSSRDGRFNCGIWTGAVGAWRVTFTENEFCHLLEGVIRVTASDGASRTFRGGDAFVMPAGFEGVWEVLEPARKYYAVYE